MTERRPGANAGRPWRRLLVPGLVAGVLMTGALEAWASAQSMIEPQRTELTIRGAGATADPAAMRRIIIEAAVRRGWRVVLEEPGRLTLRVVTHDHSATVDVLYDAGGFQIKYHDSVDMDYAVEGGRPLIHPRYNRWITELGNEIGRGAHGAVRQRQGRHAIDPAIQPSGEDLASAPSR